MTPPKDDKRAGFRSFPAPAPRAEARRGFGRRDEADSRRRAEQARRARIAKGAALVIAAGGLALALL